MYSYIVDFGVSKKCSSTRLAAVYKEELSGNYIPARQNPKLICSTKGKKVTINCFNIKDLGVSKNEKSYIAITHIDGNRMGKRISN